MIQPQFDFTLFLNSCCPYFDLELRFVVFAEKKSGKKIDIEEEEEWRR